MYFLFARSSALYIRVWVPLFFLRGEFLCFFLFFCALERVLYSCVGSFAVGVVVVVVVVILCVESSFFFFLRARSHALWYL